MFGQSLTTKVMLLLFLLSNSFLVANCKSKWHLIETKGSAEAESDVSSLKSQDGSVEKQKTHGDYDLGGFGRRVAKCQFFLHRLDLLIEIYPQETRVNRDKLNT